MGAMHVSELIADAVHLEPEEKRLVGLRLFLTLGMLMMGLTHRGMRRQHTFCLAGSRLLVCSRHSSREVRERQARPSWIFPHPKDEESDEHNEYHTTSDREHSVNGG